MQIEIYGRTTTRKTTLTKQLSYLGFPAIFAEFSSIPFLFDLYKTPELYAYEAEIVLLQNLFQKKLQVYIKQ